MLRRTLAIGIGRKGVLFHWVYFKVYNELRLERVYMTELQEIRPGFGLSFCSHCLVRSTVHSRHSTNANVHLNVQTLELDA